MKRALAIGLLLMSFVVVASAVKWKAVCEENPPASINESQPPAAFSAEGIIQLADGSGLPPATTTKPPKPNLSLADGSGLPPTQKKPPKPTTVQMADGSGLPPATTTNPGKPLGSAMA